MVFYDYTNKNTLEVYRDMCYVIYKNQGLEVMKEDKLLQRYRRYRSRNRTVNVGICGYKNLRNPKIK